MKEENIEIKKVLFVDDELNILKSLRRELMDANFEVIIANSGTEGLKILGEEKIDLVISDVKMPMMDGIQFLSLVKERHPNIQRIILSGFVEKSLAMSSIIKGIANSYFTKPWNIEILKNSIEHVLEINKILHQKDLLTLINSIEKLPTLPSLYQKFLEAINAECSIKEISKIIEDDVSIGTRILRVANSAFYGSLRLSSIERAIIHLGLNIIKDIVLTVSLVSSKTLAPQKKTYLQEIYTHSSQVNHLIPKLYSAIMGNRLDDNHSSIGITMDIGKIILLQYFPKRFISTILLQNSHKGKNFYECELELGFENITHAEIGSYFLSWWNLPIINVETAMFHHTPTCSISQYQDIIKIVAIADDMVYHFRGIKDKINLSLHDTVSQYISRENFEQILNQIKGEIYV